MVEARSEPAKSLCAQHGSFLAPAFDEHEGEGGDGPGDYGDNGGHCGPQ